VTRATRRGEYSESSRAASAQHTMTAITMTKRAFILPPRSCWLWIAVPLQHESAMLVSQDTYLAASILGPISV
jgi:hypothetical protein